MFYYSEKQGKQEVLEDFSFGMAVSKEAIGIILTNFYCRNNFLLLCCLAKTVLFCGLTQTQKSKIASLIKKGMGNSILLALGSEDYDIPLFIAADLSICMDKDNSKPLILTGVADIVVENITFPEVILTLGYRIREHLNTWGQLIFTFVAITGFYFIANSLYLMDSSNPRNGNIEGTHFNRIIPIISSLILFPTFLFRPSRETIMCFPTFYKEGREKFLSLIGLFKGWVLSILLVTVYRTLLNNTFYLGFGNNGREADLTIYKYFSYFGLTHLVMGTIIMINLNIKGSIALWLLLFLSAITILYLFVYQAYLEDNPWLYFSEYASHSPAIMFAFLCIALIFAVYYFYQCFPLFRTNVQSQSAISKQNKKVAQYKLLVALNEQNLPDSLLHERANFTTKNNNLISKK